MCLGPRGDWFFDFVVAKITGLVILWCISMHAASQPTPKAANNNCAPSYTASTSATHDTTIAPVLDTPTHSPRRTAAPRIGVWGDSHTASGAFINRAMQQWGFDRAQTFPSLIPPLLTTSGTQLALKKYCASQGWKTSFAHQPANKRVKFGPTQSQLSSDTENAYLWLDFRSPRDETRLVSLSLLYSKDSADRSLILGIAIDGDAEQLVDLSASRGPIFQIKPKSTFATLRIRLVVGQINIHGFEPQYNATAQAVLDVLSIPGATAAGWSNDLSVPPAKSPIYDTIIFAYGTNEAMDPNFNDTEYSLSFKQAVSKLRRLYPQAQCLLISPPPSGDMRRNQTHERISRIQAAIGREHQCRVWNWQAALRQAGLIKHQDHLNNAVISPDRTHLTREGYEVSGQLFAQELSWKH